MDNLSYFHMLAATTGIKPVLTEAEIAKVTAFAAKIDINKFYFEEYFPKARGLRELPAGIEAAIQMAGQYASKGRLRGLENRWREAQSALNTMASDFRARVAETFAARREYLEALKYDSAIDLSEEFHQILEAGLWEYKTANSVTKVVTFQAARPMAISYKHEKAGVDLKLELGKPLVNLELQTGKIKVQSDGPRPLHNGYWHPHIGRQGDICWGEAAQTVAEALPNGRFNQVLTILWSLLETYNSDSPYTTLADLCHMRDLETSPRYTPYINPATGNNTWWIDLGVASLRQALRAGGLSDTWYQWELYRRNVTNPSNVYALPAHIDETEMTDATMVTLNPDEFEQENPNDENEEGDE